MRPTIIFVLVLLAAHATSFNVMDYAPYFAADLIQPYPPLKDPSGTNISVGSLRGTRLFGFNGCSNERGELIQKAFDDFHTLANQLQVYNKIDWNDQAAKDFWGPASGPYQIPADTRKEILQIFEAAQQIYYFWWNPLFPWEAWKSLWIEVRCSDGKKGKGAPDPEDTCGDAEPERDKCPNGQPPVGGGKTTLQAFSDNMSQYSRITFCTDFFKLQELTVAVENGKNLPASRKKDLSKWDNQARCMFHEITHLDYFMNAGPGDKGKSPYVSDLEILYNNKGKRPEWYGAYGPYNARLLARYLDADPRYSGYYTQRNADNYAWFALAKYVEQQIGEYPSLPSSGTRKLEETPRDAQTHEAPQSLGPSTGPDTLSGSSDDNDIDSLDNDNYPGCGDKLSLGTVAPALSSSVPPDMPPSTAAPGPTQTPAPPSGPKIDSNCNGVGSKKYMSATTLTNNIKAFCKDAVAQGVQDQNSGSIARNYNPRSLDDVNLIVDWPPGVKLPFDEAECINQLGVILNKCDVNDPTNPMNWKGGGTNIITTTNLGRQVVYHIIPNSARQALPNTPGGSCHVKYKFIYDEFWIWGNGYSTSAYGQEDGGLLQQLQSCNGLTGWTFNYGLDSDGREWSAHGHLLIGKAWCVARAIGSAGGPSGVGCSGST